MRVTGAFATLPLACGPNLPPPNRATLSPHAYHHTYYAHTTHTLTHTPPLPPSLSRYYAWVLVLCFPARIACSQLAIFFQAQRIMSPSLVAAVVAVFLNLIFGYEKEGEREREVDGEVDETVRYICVCVVSRCSF